MEVLKLNDGEVNLTREIKMRVLNYLNDKYTNPETDELLTNIYLSGLKVQDHLHDH
jgi:hypothetical protein